MNQTNKDMTYNDLQQQYGFRDFLTGNTIIEGGSMETNINGDGKLTFSWRQSQGGAIPLGTTIEVGGEKYIALETYAPTLNVDGTYTFSPTFTEWSSLASKTVFSMQLQTNTGEAVTLYTFPYVGDAGTIVSALNRSLESQLGMRVFLGDSGLSSQLISISIDGESVKSVADKVASSLGVSAYFVGGGIQIGGSNAYSADTYYNRFIVLGGTRNMGKKILSGSDGQGYAQVTQRLTLESGGGESVIDLSGGEPPMTKILIFDDIYPKAFLEITSVGRRECYVFDEHGERVVDHMEGPVAVYKKYTKWYITLGVSGGASGGSLTPYEIATSDVIQGQPLGILFESGALKGRQFDLAYFAESTQEHSDDDVSPSGYLAPGGSYRIIMQADGSVLLPNDTLQPSVGDKVSPINVALDDSYYAKAREELRERAEEYIALYNSKKVSEFEAESYSGSHGDFLLEVGGGSVPSRGSSYGGSGYVVTSVKRDLLSGHTTITFGTFKKKGLLQSIVDKVEGVSVSGGGGTVGEDAHRQTSPLGEDQYKAMRDTVGSPALVATNRRLVALDETLETFGTDIRSVKAQSDKKFDIHFYRGAPSLDAPPSSLWQTDLDRDSHVHDIYYDTSREAGGSGGRAWRYVKAGTDVSGTLIVDSSGAPVAYDATTHAGYTYVWAEISDLDTLASLEKIADVSNDGILSGGTEKVRILGEWRQALSAYASYRDKDAVYGSPLSTLLSSFRSSFLSLGKMLNGDTALTEVDGVLSTPLWLCDLTHDTVLSEQTYVDDSGQPVAMTSAYYRSKWDAYYDSLQRLQEQATGHATTVANSKMQNFMSHSLPTPPYQTGDLWHKLIDDSPGTVEGDNYICVTGRSGGEAALESDWIAVNKPDEWPSVSTLLAELVMLLEPVLLEFERLSSQYTVDVRLVMGVSQPSAELGTIWYDGTNVRYRQVGTWALVPDSTNVLRVLSLIRGQIGERTLSIYDHLPSSGSVYDIAWRQSSFSDSLTGVTVSGGIAVWVYGPGGWRLIQENDTGLLKNYGDSIVSAVFGSSTLAALGLADYASGLVTVKNQSEMFSRALNAATGHTALAAIRTLVKTDPLTGEFTGEVGIDADKVNFSSQLITFLDTEENTRFGMDIGYSTQFIRPRPGSPVTVRTVGVGLFVDGSERDYLLKAGTILDGGVAKAVLELRGLVNVEGNICSQGYSCNYNGSEHNGVTGTFYAQDISGNALAIRVEGGIVTGINEVT